MDVAAIMSSKIYGVPTVLVGLVGIGGVYYLYRQYSAPAVAPVTDTVGGNPTTSTQPLFQANPVDSAMLNSAGSTTPTPSTTAAPEASNSTWTQQAVTWLVQNKGVSVTTAQTAIDDYLNGVAMPYETGKALQDAVTQYGAPPQGVTPGATVNPANVVASVQGATPCNHVVKGPQDNSWSVLGGLYYGNSTVDAVSLLKGANPTNAAPTPGISSTVHIPKWHNKRLYKATSATNTAAKIAAKNGISTAQLYAMNSDPVMQFPVKVGTSVRVS